MNPAAHRALVRRFLADESGITAVEYGVLSCVVALVGVSAASSGTSLPGLYRAAAQLAGALVGASGQTSEPPANLGH